MKPARHSQPKYPLGTLIAYGPDNTRATKLVAAVYKRPDHETADVLHRWLLNEGDIRNDPGIASEIAEFFKQHGVKQTTTYDRILGCPHEEGIDYPMGRACPHCPFWAKVDRFTHEPIRPPAPSRSPEEILAELSVVRDTQPLEALRSADAHREALTEPLLRALERGLAKPSGLPAGEALLFSYATYLFAKWREPRAYPLFVRWLSLPGESAHDLGGGTVTEDGKRLLASVCDGNLEPIQQLVLNREADEYCRGQAVEALALLANWSEVPRQPIEDYFLWLAREGLERECNHVWNCLCAACLDMEALGVFPELRRAYDEGLIEPGGISLEELAEVEAGPRGKWISDAREWCPPIMDVAEATAWWSCFKRKPRMTARQLAQLARTHTQKEPTGTGLAMTYVASPMIGRNDPCPCGSGKKYKKCCGK
ncbi:MAG TPA: DUF1186 domain-containing protein [Verrucomicrobiae bacterium]